jgi:DNA-binding response OmpR family regulator
MKVLIAEDDPNTLKPYQVALDARGHKVLVTDNGEDCLKIYREESGKHHPSKDDNPSPFDAVLLDYRMPKKDGMEVAKEILELNPSQRIIFASAYVKDTLVDSVKQLRRAVELMQKPFKIEALIDTLEDREIYDELKKLNVDAEAFKAVNPTHDQITNLLEAMRRLQKNRTF